MGAYKAFNVMDDAAACMNDSIKSFYTYAVQLPYLNMAYRDLDMELQLSEIPITLIDEAVISVSANATELTLPTSFFLPIKLQEKGASDTEYVDMVERRFVDDETIQKSTTLRYWDFRHNCINFIGSTAPRTVKLYYWRTFPEFVDQNSDALVNGGRNFLAFRTALLCAQFIAGGPARDRIVYLRQEVEDARYKLIASYVKANQGNSVRRKPFRILVR